MQSEKRGKRYFTYVIVIMLVVFAAIQVIPYGRDHTNPPVSKEPQWDSVRTRELFFRACKDCHSNETEWPWYSKIAPASWLVQHDVNEARSNFNVSVPDWAQNEGNKAAKLIREGEMPLWYYLPAHPGARLSDAEKEELSRGLVATFSTK